MMSISEIFKYFLAIKTTSYFIKRFLSFFSHIILIKCYSINRNMYLFTSKNLNYKSALQTTSSSKKFYFLIYVLIKINLQRKEGCLWLPFHQLLLHHLKICFSKLLCVIFSFNSPLTTKNCVCVFHPHLLNRFISLIIPSFLK